MGARLNQNKPVIVWMPCERIGCGEAFMLTSKKPTQRFCCHACYAASISPKPYDSDLFQSTIYQRWANMKSRCNDPNEKAYPYYGGRGIRVCERWHAFANFLEDMGPTFQADLTLDRIDVNGDYTPDNCRWVDRTTQARNKRNNTRLDYNGESLTIPEWAERTRIKRSTLSMRYYSYGWSIERCLTAPVQGG